ncbi:MAG: tRNA (adenine-N1)-methyltransferase [SAR202 cluster bacterium]|jgi:tRNA (adenine57-N1/adenine58-N1)-methyltransferase|nr:tRNA (adenine-N1)-methyltransferase [SAR202 cluster bacterium]MDP7104239.1 tRNA (adenine-N1)-methyltransferase [SAR202 cluster bacterium]MDP7226123.1 tRNA (adenine-N1)-methyltransferase [SAR202 cluster bacterium]MDP7412844.1 tRNA (adenine-N1)-methyltransferase [SAR202 cluster bacterium]MDP7534794.1 tRNA (adenine-N1)-methyltransferase [SAR202 cluster bacterium]|tara:strand:+ start:5729 stop:6577 length:849 start_codon:yes stop_codon:yes gene_type:complete
MTEDTIRVDHNFHGGDTALLIDRRGRQYLVQLDEGSRFESHIGKLDIGALIGQPEGSWVMTGSGHRYVAFKPTLADLTLRMPRLATVMYPKDLGALLVYADLFAGARVLEAGSGSGATTMTLLRAVGESGEVISYDLRQDMLDQAQENVEMMSPEHPNLTFKQGDVYEGILEDNLDRIVLDLPEPWHVVPHAAEKLVPGGIFFSFLPTVPQVMELTYALKDTGTFHLIETMEVMMRPWNVSGRSVRPSHRMVGHTGFINTARKCSPRPEVDNDSEAASNRDR